MPYYETGQSEPYSGFAKGMDRDSPATAIAEGHYEDGLNILLRGVGSGQHPSTMYKDKLLDADITWPTGNLYWFAPYTYSTYNATTGLLAFETHLLTLRDTGAFWRYDSGSPGTSTLVRRMALAAVNPTIHFIYDQWLNVLNGRDAPMKYGQHFLWDGQEHAIPFLFPLGSKPISPLIPSITGETWVHGGTSGFETDAAITTTFAANGDTGGGSRVSTHSLLVSTSATSTVTFADTHDYKVGPRPYGGTDFADTDYLQFQYYKTAKAGDLSIVFYNTTVTKYVTFTLTSANQTIDSWQTATLLRSAGVASGGFAAADWAEITKIDITNSDASNNMYIDDLYWLYANAPPAALVGTAHKDRIILGGVPVAGDFGDPALSTIFYSSSAKPDEFPTTNTQIISGGAQSLSRTNRISALREYGDAVIVGTQNSIFAWTIGTDGAPSRTVITTETGIDSPRAIVETPSGSLLFPWQRGIYILRQTGRNFISEKIGPLLANTWAGEPWWTHGLRYEKTKTIRFWYRVKEEDAASDPTATTTGVVFDYVRATDAGGAVWPSRMSQVADFAGEAYVEGVRETLYCKYAEQGIYRLHVDKGGTLESSITLPWLGTGKKDKIARWIGVTVPYSATATVRVFIRYANHPNEFDVAEFEEVQALVQNPDMTDPGRVYFGKNSRWAQVKFQAQDYGFEIFPPLTLIEAPTVKVQ